MTINDIYTRARYFLNDTGSLLFTDAILLEAVKAANDELSDELVSNGISVQKDVQKEIDYTANAETLTLTSISDMIVPVKLWERAEDSTDNYRELIERAWDPEEKVGTELVYWNWRNNAINLLPATTNREVRVDYIRTLTEPASSATNSEVLGSKNYLSYKTAAIAVESISGNTVEADRLHGLAAKHLNKLLGIGVRNSQGIRTRRKPFRLFR